MMPLILEDIPKDSVAYKEELFGPVFSLYKFYSIKEAIELANDSPYGLSGSVYSTDINMAKEVAS
jgi:succinate-semialdehyde dehydrogenase/glutarate-semialdehyde dehydrogenase